MQESMDHLADEASFAGPVYLKTGATSAVRAVLARTELELVLAVADGECFRAPLPVVEKVEFPWWYFGGGMRVTVNGDRYVLSFSPPARVEGEDPRWMRSYEESFGEAASARRSSKKWKAALAGVGQDRSA